MVLSACLLKSHIKGKGSLWCGSRAAAAAALQWQAVDEACPPPALTLRLLLRRGDSDRFAWKKPFRFIRGGRGGGGGEQGCRAERLPTAGAAAVISSNTKRHSSASLKMEKTRRRRFIRLR